MTPKLFRVGILITERCNAGCRHCWFDCHPNGETIQLSLGKKIIEEAKSLGAEWVSFTGGEPFLEYEKLRSLVSYAKHLGIKTEIVTSCEWAAKYDDAHNNLDELKGNGLDVINLSVDDFHQENIPLENVLNCFRASKSLNLKTVFLVSLRKNSRITSKSLKTLMNDENIQVIGQEKKNKTSALVIESGFQPVGRGVRVLESEWKKEFIKQFNPCGLVLRDIGVSPQGEVYPCCGPLGSLRQRGKIGNIRDRTLGEILNEAWENETFRKIASKGPTSLVSCQDFSKYVDKCHLCYEAIRNTV